jgi:Rieske Fe-S protein
MRPDTLQTETSAPAGVDRRAFCACALALGAVTACGGGGGGTSSNPAGGGGGGGTPTPITTTDTKSALLAQPAGTVRSYANGASACPDSPGSAQGAYLVRDATGIYAISASCLHLGGRIQPNGGGFACPCHGSQYNLGGTVTGGPAPVGSVLSHYEVRESAPGAVLVIDTTKTVDASVRLN